MMKNEKSGFETINESPIWSLLFGFIMLVTSIAIFSFKVVVFTIAVMLYFMLTAKAGE